MSNHALVLDANILISAVLGRRVRDLIYNRARPATLFAPSVAYDDAKKYLPALLKKRGEKDDTTMFSLAKLRTSVGVIEHNNYDHFRVKALERIARRDPDDWPVLACAMALDCPIWTEDTDFFGTGVATWTTDRIHIYLRMSIT